MLTDIFAQGSTVSRLRNGIAGAYLDDFTGWLVKRSYTESTIRSYVYAAVRLLAWVKTAGYDIPNLNQVSLDGYRKQLVATDLSGNRNGERSNAYCGARRFVLFLQEKGIVQNTLGLLAESPPIEAFCHWMRQHRGVTESTLAAYRPVVCALIRTIGALPSSYTAGKLRHFFWNRPKTTVGAKPRPSLPRFECSSVILSPPGSVPSACVMRSPHWPGGVNLQYRVISMQATWNTSSPVANRQRPWGCEIVP